VAAAVGVLDVAAAAPVSGEEDEVAVVVAGGVRASQEGAAAPTVVGREEDGRAAADAAGGQREIGGEARRWERRDARLQLQERSARRGGGAERRCGDSGAGRAAGCGAARGGE
jgi:hypothetical protein